jgi:hypothetical protein
MGNGEWGADEATVLIINTGERDEREREARLQLHTSDVLLASSRTYSDISRIKGSAYVLSLSILKRWMHYYGHQPRRQRF